MPFYFYPAAKSWISFEDTFLTFVDWTIDAHEENRNINDRNRSFYQRSVYFYSNYLRWQNDTVSNLMFDTKLGKNEYALINSVVSQQNTKFYLSATGLHTVSFMYLAYFFRFRRVSLAPVFAISCAYYVYFTFANNLLYKLIVDNKVISATRSIGQGQHV